MKKMVLAALAAMTLAGSAQAATEVYNISWTGTNGYTMTGNFTFDTSAGNEVRDYEVSSLSIDVLLNGSSIGTWSLPTVQDSDFNFNFNAATGQFFTGGVSTSETGQRWNYQAEVTTGAVGFGSGAGAQAVSDPAGNPSLGFQTDFTSLRATRVTPAATVPEPASWAMMVAGFGLAGAAMRRRRATVRFA